MGVVNILQAQKSIAAVMEIGPDDGTFGVASTDQNLMTADEVIERLLQSDAQVCNWITDSSKHGQRGRFLANSADLASGSKIPFHPGKLGTVQIKLQSGAYVIGEEAPSISAFRQWQAHPNIWPVADIQGRFIITDEHIIEFIGAFARIQIPAEFVIDRATPACQAPEEHTGAVIRGAIVSMPRRFNLEIVRLANEGWAHDEIAIRSGAMQSPPFRVAA